MGRSRIRTPGCILVFHHFIDLKSREKIEIYWSLVLAPVFSSVTFYADSTFWQNTRFLIQDNHPSLLLAHLQLSSPKQNLAHRALLNTLLKISFIISHFNVHDVTSISYTPRACYVSSFEFRKLALKKKKKVSI